MMGHPNEELVSRGYDAFAKGDIDALRSLLDPDVVWHQPGRSVLAGDHRGADAVLGFFATTMQLTAGSFRAEPHDVIAGDQHVVGLHLARGERQGRTFADRQVLVVHVRDGKIAEVWDIPVTVARGPKACLTNLSLPGSRESGSTRRASHVRDLDRIRLTSRVFT
jgi:ketosteroid isomerase-like protein